MSLSGALTRKRHQSSGRSNCHKVYLCGRLIAAWEARHDLRFD